MDAIGRTRQCPATASALTATRVFISCSLPFSGDGLDTIGRFQKIFDRVGEAEAEVAITVRAERTAVQTRDTGVLQQEIGEVFRRNTSVFHVSKGVERAVGRCAVKARNLVERRTKGITALAKLSNHAIYLRLRARQSIDRGALGETGGAGIGIDHEFVYRVDQPFRA